MSKPVNIKGHWAPAFGTVPLEAAVAMTPAQLRVYVLLCGFANALGEAWPRTSTLASMLGLSRRRVRAIVQELKAIGWVEEAPAEPDDERLRLPHVAGLRAEGEQPGRMVTDRGAEGEQPDQAEIPLLGTDQRTEAASADAPAPQKPRAKKQEPPSDQEILQRAEAEGWLEAWAEELKTFDGQEGRRTMRGEIVYAMGWQREKRANWKKDQHRFLDNWLRRANKSNAPSHASYQRRQGFGRQPHVIEENPVRPGFNFNTLYDDDEEAA